MLLTKNKKQKTHNINIKNNKLWINKLRYRNLWCLQKFPTMDYSANLSTILILKIKESYKNKNILLSKNYIEKHPTTNRTSVYYIKKGMLYLENF